MSVWFWAMAPVIVAAPVWWVLKGLGYVTLCPIRWFLQQSARTFRRYWPF